jgi:broad specificity phosphatase PhoE
MGSVENLKNLRDQHHQFYLVVYTQTDAHANKYICGGGLDLGLNEEGIEEARKFSRRFKKNPLKIKRLISSPELRSIQMADILHDEMKGKLVLAREFSDQFMGDLEGKPIQPGQDFANPPRGETSEQFSLRVRKGLERILEEKDSVVLVTHLRVARKVFEWIGLAAEKIEPATMYAIDLPAGTGIAHFREV